MNAHTRKTYNAITQGRAPRDLEWAQFVTLWRDADLNTSSGWLPSMMGQRPRYRYEIQVVPEGSQRSKIIVNVRTEGIPDEKLASYKASNRFALFKEIDER